MTMIRILFIGDIVGKPGRECVKALLPGLGEKNNIDLVLANGENAAGGLGITEAVYRELREAGIDVITGGNHIWENKDVFRFIDREPALIRPANYPAGLTPGQGSTVVKVKGKPVGILNLEGRVFMQPLDCPFQKGKEEVDGLRKETNTIVVDFHAEATAEKMALGWYLNGVVSAVVGSHTHVQTSDERLLPGGTAYITDVGMTGLYDSVIGADCEPVLKHFLTRLPGRWQISGGKKQFNAVVISIDWNTGKAQSIERIKEVI